MTDKTKNGELVQEDEAQIDLNALVPLAAQFIKNSHEQFQAQSEFQRENLRLSEEKLKIEKSTFTHKYWLLFLITIVVLGIAAGLIFLKNDTVSGMAMLSHVGAVVIGMIAGSGWERMRAK